VWYSVTPEVLRLILGSVAIILVAAFLGELLSRIIRSLLRHAGARKGTQNAVRDALRAIWIGLAGLGVFALVTGQGPTSILAASGIAALVLSFSIQTTLTNMISGILLLRDRALRVGDQISYSGVKGRVIRIALRNTWVLAEDGSVAIIANASLTSGPLINYTASSRFASEYGP
jgi:small-conductance mechanosensitive channel